jgi:aldose 1-epimerase
VLTYGGIITSIRVPDCRGRIDDVVLGFSGLGPYLANLPYFGAIIGRIAGRVSGARFTLEGRDYLLARNNGHNHLHGGRVGLDKRVWSAQPVVRADGFESLRLYYRSPDGEENYPGTLDITVTYTLTAANALVIETEAIADRVTPLSMTNHSYFNLAGEGAGSIAAHTLQIDAESYVPTDDSMTLSGRCMPTEGQASDFSHPRILADAIPDLFMSHGDLYLLRGPGEAIPERPTVAARAVEPGSGRVLEVSTNEACLQFYTGLSLDGTLVGKSGRAYGPHAGFALECEGYPDGVSVPQFGDILLRPQQPQRRMTIYAFSSI